MALVATLQKHIQICDGCVASAAPTSKEPTDKDTIESTCNAKIKDLPFPISFIEPSNSARKRVLDKAINFVSQDMKPFSAIEASGFLDLAQELVDIRNGEGRVNVK